MPMMGLADMIAAGPRIVCRLAHAVTRQEPRERPMLFITNPTPFLLGGVGGRGVLDPYCLPGIKVCFRGGVFCPPMYNVKAITINLAM